VGIDYNSNDDELTYKQYLEFSEEWMKNCYDWSKTQARFLLNIPLDKNKGGHKSVGAGLTRIAQNVGWKYHSTIIWNEGNISRRTAWGAWMKALAPYVQHIILEKRIINKLRQVKKMFIRLYEAAKAIGDKKTMDFCVRY